MSALKWIALVLFGCLLSGCSGLAGWTLMAGDLVPVPAVTGDPVRGETLFQTGTSEAPPCSACHQVVQGGHGFNLGPNLQNIAEQAGARLEGVSAHQYIEASILHPHDFVVPGFRDIMYDGFADHLSAQDIADLIAYLLTL